MKKKAIEKIDFLGLPKTSRKKEVQFIGVTAWKNVAHERHFFLEVYRNDKNCRDVPVVRIVATQKDFATYTPEDGQWTRAKIKSHPTYNALIWEDHSTGFQERRKQNTLFDTKDLERLKKFFKNSKVYDDADWWEYIEQHQDNITCKARREAETRKWQRRKEALADRAKNTPELPEQELLSWADRVVFRNKHFLYYKKKGRRAAVCCSACGGVAEGAWRGGESYESQFEKHIAEPIDKHIGICSLCGEYGTYKPQGMARTAYSISTNIFKSDKYKETGAVIRYIELEKEWQLEENVNERGELEMVGAYEKLSGIEIARTYLFEGKAQTDFHKRDPWIGEEFWDDCNLYGMANIKIGEGLLYPGFSRNLEGTDVQYSAIELYEAAVGKVNAKEYMERYQQTPQIEMLVKLKLYGVVERLIRCYYGIIANQNANRPDEFLGVRKEKMKLLMENQGDEKLLNVLQMEKRMDARWTDEQTKALAEIGASRTDLEMVLTVMTLQKMLNQVKKYAGCEYGTMCSSAMARLKHTATTYFDYLRMRAQLGYNLENTVYQRPRNLENAHNKMVNEIDKEKTDKRLREVAEKYPLIRKNYRKLRNRYFFEDDNFIIRPARSAEEIVQEGRILHHCVGGDNYLKKHNKQETVILMLRFKDEQETPYITVEIRGEQIVQWYGAHDKKPDEKNIQRWLDAYVTRMKCNRLGVAKKPEQEVMQQMLAYA